jgi:hypothetical protein
MTTSGTYSFDLSIDEIMEDAHERIGKNLRSGYDYRTARRSLNYLLSEWQNRGLNLWKIKNASQALTAGTYAYPLSSEKLDIIEGLLRTDEGSTTGQVDLTMTRVSVSHYAHQTNKLTQGRPINYWIERSPTGITVNMWPVPDATVPYFFNYYYMEQIEDVGSPATNNIDVPTRHLPALTAGLAYQLALKTPSATQMLPQLKAEYEEQWNLAADSVREKASLFITPGGYRNI